jgi:hydrogenase maturation protease
MLRVLVIGYGNTLRGDDALGPTVIERLRTQLPGPEYLSCQQLGPELAEPLAACDLAIFVDAAAGGIPGEVHVEHLAPADSPSTMTHHVKPTTLLAMAQELYGHAPHARLVSSAGASFESGEELSPECRRAVDESCRLVRKVIGDFPAMW